MDIKDKVIVVTGAAQGIGRAYATGLSKKGAKIALVDINEDKLKEAQALCETDTQYYVANVADESDVVAIFENVVSDFGTVDGLINNAGITRDGLLVKEKEGNLEKMSLEKWKQVIDVNLTGVFLAGREMAAQLVRLKKPGVIINISSISQAGNMGQTNYSATKAGVVAMTTTWAKELSRYGIRVAAIAPGFIGTDMVEAIRPDVLEKITKSIPLGRLGKPEEICNTAAFILENDYLSGRVIEIDGGLRL